MARKKKSEPAADTQTPKPLEITRDRPGSMRGIKELVWVRKQDLIERKNPRNWRRHPRRQVDALESSLRSNGWAGALLYNLVTGRIIDGHARSEVDLQRVELPDWVPVLVGEWTEDQEKAILLTLDPIAAMAEENAEALKELADEVAHKLQVALDELADKDPESPKIEVLEGVSSLIEGLQDDAVVLSGKGDPRMDNLAVGYKESSTEEMMDDQEINRQEQRRYVRCPGCGSLVSPERLSQPQESESPKSPDT